MLEKNTRYRRIIDAISDGIYLVDREYTLTAINRSEAAYFKAHPKDLVGRKCYEVFWGRDDVCPNCYVKRCFVNGQGQGRLREKSFKVGRPYVNIFYHPIIDPGEQCCEEVVVYIQDASAMVALEEKTAQAEKMVSLGQMAAGIAHDLNNFLASIYGIVQLLQMMREDNVRNQQKEDHLFQRLVEQVEALNLLAKNLSLFSHPDQEDILPISLNQIVKEVLSFSRYELEREQVVVNCQLADDLPLTPMMKTQMEQVLLNLMMNAAHAIREKRGGGEVVEAGEIIVRTWCDKGWVGFSVGDNGCGIPEDKFEAIMQPYYSTKSTSSGSGKGTGLGLPTVKTIVDKHSGILEWESHVGVGSTFIVKLPVAGRTDRETIV